MVGSERLGRVEDGVHNRLRDTETLLCLFCVCVVPQTDDSRNVAEGEPDGITLYHRKDFLCDQNLFI